MAPGLSWEAGTWQVFNEILPVLGSSAWLGLPGLEGGLVGQVAAPETPWRRRIMIRVAL